MLQYVCQMHSEMKLALIIINIQHYIMPAFRNELALMIINFQQYSI